MQKLKNIREKNVFDYKQTKIKSFNDSERKLLQEELICYTRCTFYYYYLSAHMPSEHWAHLCDPNYVHIQWEMMCIVYVWSLRRFFPFRRSILEWKKNSIPFGVGFCCLVHDFMQWDCINFYAIKKNMSVERGKHTSKTKMQMLYVSCEFISIKCARYSRFAMWIAQKREKKPRLNSSTE